MKLRDLLIEMDQVAFETHLLIILMKKEGFDDIAVSPDRSIIIVTISDKWEVKIESYMGDHECTWNLYSFKNGKREYSDFDVPLDKIVSLLQKLAKLSKS